MQPFQRFHRRFLSEQLRSACWAGCAGLLGGIAVSLLLRLSGRQLPLPFGVALSAALCLICAWAGYRQARVPPGTQAARLDAAGLEERAVTMEENLTSQAPMARLQRLDAEEKLSALPPERVRIRQPKGLIIAAALLLLLTLGLSAAVWAQESAKPGETNPERLALRQRMLELEQTIRESALSEGEKALLLEELNRLSAAQEDPEASFQQMDSLEKLWEAFENARKMEEERQNSFAGLLTRYALTRDLGFAILRGSAQLLEDAFDGMARHCVPGALSPENTNALIEDIFRAGKDTEQKDLEYLDILLWNTLRDMAYTLQEALETPPEEGAETALKAIENTKAFLKELLFGEEAEKEEPSDAAGDQSAASGDEENRDAAELTVSSVRAGGGAAGAGLGGGEEEKRRLTVLCYDPSQDTGRQADYIPGAPGPDGTPQRRPAREAAGQGLTPYDRVFGAYYAEYLRQELPEEIKEAAARYFDGL